MNQSTLAGISEQIVLQQHNIFDKPEELMNHPKMCRCIGCRTFYEEELTLCSHSQCGYEPLNNCDKKFCFTHCRKNCGNHNG